MPHHYYFNVFIWIVVSIKIFFIYLQVRIIFDILAFKACSNELFILLIPHLYPSNLMFPAIWLKIPFPAGWALLSCHFLCLNATLLNSNASLLMEPLWECFEMPDFRQISHSVIQALYVAWGSFWMPNVIKGLSKKKQPSRSISIWKWALSVTKICNFVLITSHKTLWRPMRESRMEP